LGAFKHNPQGFPYALVPACMQMAGGAISAATKHSTTSDHDTTTACKHPHVVLQTTNDNSTAQHSTLQSSRLLVDTAMGSMRKMGCTWFVTAALTSVRSE